MQEAYALQFGSGTARTCELSVKLPAWSNTVVICYTNSGTWTESLTNLLTIPIADDLLTDYTSMITLTPNLQFDNQTINNAPFTKNDGCSRTSNFGLIEGQWSIFRPLKTAISNLNSFIIAVASQAGDNTRGLQIGADGNTLKFNCNVFVDIAIDQTITGIKHQDQLEILTQIHIVLSKQEAGQEGKADRGLRISDDGNILTFNGGEL
ncbi:MAG: hypothetical protein EZS28_017263 [Streblomastix strix]|uniref:Uncharacterized protein n=1 Tax=Streblomastix strix TaxID=222440 RepID=A0A5J4VX50_9EUKA|nr:MAG: hypothetical protein EZS28_017263 [Streblomastix strix]